MIDIAPLVLTAIQQKVDKQHEHTFCHTRYHIDGLVPFQRWSWQVSMAASHP